MDHIEALSGLKDACKAKNKVNVIGRAVPDARAHFNLETKVKIFDFIRDGLEGPEHINTREWEGNPNKVTPAHVYSFSFFSGAKFGYLAFIHITTTDFWLVKSLKANTSPDPRNLPFRNCGLLELKKQLKRG